MKIIPSFPGPQPLCSWSVPGPIYLLITVLLSFPSLTGGLTGTTAACLFGGFRSISTSCSSSFFLLSLRAPNAFPVPVIRCQNFLNSFPSLTGTKPACLFGGFRSRSTSCSSSFFLLSLCAPNAFPVPVIRCQNFFNSFPSLTGTKPACLTGEFRSRATICSTSFFFLWKLVYECCTLGIHQ